MNTSIKLSPLSEWVVICRVPSEESAYLYFFLELFEGIFNFSTQDHVTGDRSRNLICITNETTLEIARNLIDDIKEVLNLEIVENWRPVDETYTVK